MNRIIAYWAYDPINNNEGIITNFDLSALKQAEANGFIIIAEHEDGTREKVKAENVTEPNTQDSGFLVFVTPEYVDTRITAAYEAIKSIADAITPLLSAELTQDGQPSPLDAITANLEKLRALSNINKNGDDNA